ncbi:Calcineurin-like phosphoesterase superfamily domain protein [compost metagenome]
MKLPEQLATELHNIEERLVFCGHSHVYHCLDLPGGQQVINPGSVGLPAYEEAEPYPHVMESGTPCASYCL